MELDPELKQKLIETFTLELDEQLACFSDGLLKLEKPSADENIEELHNLLFRTAHNIKGAARSVDIQDIAELSHSLESLFTQFKNNERKPTKKIIDICMQAVSQIREIMACYPEPFEKVMDIDSLLASEETDNNNRPAADIPQDSEELHQIPRNVENKEHMRVSVDKIDRFSSFVDEMQTIKLVMNDHFEQLAYLCNLIRKGEVQLKKNISKHSSTADEMITVLDNYAEISKSARDLSRDIKNTNSNLNYITNTLSDSIYFLRLVKVKDELLQLKLTARDISAELGKDITFNIEGEDLEVDRTLLEQLKHPLIHLLRNAIDHGIESPKERVSLGKSPTATIDLSVVNDGSKIIITLSDDGAGINIDKVKKKALKSKICSEVELQKLNEDELINLIFRPGFSTKEIITDISGRGVGMDVVNNFIETVKGKISVSSTAGQGAKFTMILPLSVSSEHAIVFKVSNQMFAIPTVFVECALQIHKKEIFSVEGSNAISVNNATIPLKDLADIITSNSSASQLPDSISVIIVNKGWSKVAFIVDEVVTEREIVIKPLSEPLCNIDNISGATLTGRGEIILVLNAVNLIQTSLRQSRSSRISTLSDDGASHSAPKILVVDDSITTRTLEKNILQARGFEVETAADGENAWQKIQANKYDLLVTDVEMPNMDGFTLTERVKNIDKDNVLPVVIVTSRECDDDKKRGIEVGADAYVVKSQFETGSLLSIIEQLI